MLGEAPPNVSRWGVDSALLYSTNPKEAVQSSWSQGALPARANGQYW
jgi:hypothetical protein